MKNVAFVSVAFGEKYVEQLHRLKRSIEAIYPENDFFYWIDELPPNSKSFADSLYGFKVHAVQHARRMGYKKIIWLDPACILVNKINYYFDIIKYYGVLAVKDESLLPNTCCDKCYDYFKVNIEDSLRKGHHLVGGSLYVFDFDLNLCHLIFNLWEKAERDGIFGSQQEQSSEQINRHRNDESVMAIALYESLSRPLENDKSRYCSEQNPIVIKKHFR